MHHPHHRSVQRVKAKRSRKKQTGLKRSLDLLVTFLGVSSVFAIIPQAVEIWAEKDAAQVSLITWAYFTLYVVVMLLYGLVHREKPIIMTYATNVVIYVVVVAGIVVYG